MPMPIKSGAVVVLYFPSQKTSELVVALADVFDQVVLVDNTPESESSVTFRACPQVAYVPLHKNTGIAHALNVGVKALKNSGVALFATFDQDSSITDAQISSLRSFLIGMRDRQYETSIWGLEFDENRSLSAKNDWVDVVTVVTSGMVFHQHVYDLVGPFEDALFIDSVDHEYCLRARSKGVQIKRSKNVMIEHNIGLDGNSLIPVHAPLRKYYQYRNTAILIGRYLFGEKLWVCRQILRLHIEFLHILVFENERLVKIKFLARGLKDAFLGRLGAHG